MTEHASLRARRRFPSAAALMLLLAACSGGGDSGPTPPIVVPVLTSVTISASSTALTVGQTMQLTAAPRDQSGNSIAASVTWSTSAPAIATVSGTGLVTPLTAGSVTITAQASAGNVNVSSSTTFTVQAAAPVPVLTSVTISAPSTSVIAGQTVQLTAAPRDQFGNPITATLSWSSSATGVATVGAATGLVSGVSAGSATITVQATAGSASASANVAISVQAAAPVLTSVTISSPSTSVVVGQTLQLTAAPRDQSGNAITATLAWTSSATGVATVSPAGLVTGVAAGSATITVQATAGGVTVLATRALTVTASPVLTSVSISAPSTSVVAGQTLQLTAAPRDQFGNPFSGATVAWSSNATGVATVGSGTGLVTGVAAGSANITALATMGSTTASAFLTIMVTAAGGGFPSSASVTATLASTFSPATVDISLGGSVEWTFAALHNVMFSGGAGAPADIPDTGSGVVSRTFTMAGTFGYTCTLHGGMNGTVIVH